MMSELEKNELTRRIANMSLEEKRLTVSVISSELLFEELQSRSIRAESIINCIGDTIKN